MTQKEFFEKIDTKLDLAIQEIIKLQKDVEYIKKDEEKTNKAFDEKIKNSELKIKGFIYKSIAVGLGSIALNYVRDFLF